MQTYTNNIEIQPNHSYFHQEVGNAMSVTTILNGGKPAAVTTTAMANGTAIHQILELFLKDRKKEAGALFKELDKEAQIKP